MLSQLRTALIDAGSQPVRLSELARLVHADPDVVRAVLAHAITRGWLPHTSVTVDAGACLPQGCAQAAANPACRGCPLAN